MPYAVTSLLPLAFFPLAGIIPGEKVGLNYFKVRRLNCLSSFHKGRCLVFKGHYYTVCGKYDFSSSNGTCETASTTCPIRPQSSWLNHQMVRAYSLSLLNLYFFVLGVWQV